MRKKGRKTNVFQHKVQFHHTNHLGYLGLVAGAIIMLIFGYNPILGYQALWNGVFDSPFFMSETVNRITPTYITGLAILLLSVPDYSISVQKAQVLVGWVAAV